MLNGEQKVALLREVERVFNAGGTLQEAVFAARDAVGVPYFDAQENKALGVLWKQLEALREKRAQAAAEHERARSKEARGVALYDALIALGWTPPDA